MANGVSGAGVSGAGVSGGGVSGAGVYGGGTGTGGGGIPPDPPVDSGTVIGALFPLYFTILESS